MKSISDMRQELAAKAAGDASFRSSLIADPKSVIKQEYGVDVPDSVKIDVHEDSAEAAHLILAPNPKLSDEDLRRVSGGQVIAGNVTGGGEASGLDFEYGPVTK